VDAVSTRVRVVAEHRPPDRPALKVRAGDRVRLGDRDDTWPAFVWTTAADGVGGWVPERHFERSGEHAIARRDYDTTELSVDPGDLLTVLEADERSGWLWCGTDDGTCGWIPVAVVASL